MKTIGQTPLSFAHLSPVIILFSIPFSLKTKTVFIFIKGIWFGGTNGATFVF
jgi:hypothetical protein